MSRPIFATDVDGVLLGWHKGFLDWVDQEHNWLIDPASAQRSYDMEEWFLPRYREDGSLEYMSKEQFTHYVVEFNSYPRALYPLEASVEVLQKIYNLGYDIVAITSFGGCEKLGEFRADYLQAVYGGIFKDVIILNLGECKKDALEEVKPEFFVEDHKDHAETAEELGIKAFLFETTYNKGSNVQYVKSWYDIWGILLDNDVSRDKLIAGF